MKKEENPADARHFINTLRSNLSPIIEKITNHPYLQALGKREIARQKLGLFVCEQYNIIANDRRNFARMASNASTNTAFKLFTDSMMNEIIALDHLLQMAAELEITFDKIQSCEPLAGCNAFTDYLTRLAVYGSDSEILCALLVDFPVWGSNCNLMSSLLKRNYNFSNKACVFLDAFAQPLPEEFVSKSCEIITSDLPMKQKEMRQAARLLIEYELLFWNTMYEYSIE